MKAAFLIRCSTKNQDLSRQTNDLVYLAKSMGYEYDLENLVYGEKITGKDDVTKRNRASIDKLLNGASQHLFDVVLVSEVSRMSRDSASGRVYVRSLINMGIPVYFKDINTWTFEPNSKPTESQLREKEQIIGAAFDAAWKYLKSMKTQIASARRNQLYNGAISVGKPFFGYKNFGGKDKLTKTRWIVDEEAAEVVMDVFNEYVKEDATLKTTSLAITNKFGERFGRKFSVGTIEHILQFESYHTGIKKITLTDPDTEQTQVFDVEIPIIVPTELFEKAEKKRNENRRYAVYPTQKIHLLSKVLRCPCCGYTMTPRIKSDSMEGNKCANGGYRIINGKRAFAWCCMTGINKATDCTNRVTIANEKIEPIIWELIKKELIYFAKLNNEERLMKVEEIEGKINFHKENISNFTKEIEKLKKRLNRAYQIAINTDDDELSVIAIEQYNQTAKSIRKEQTDFQATIDNSKCEIEKLDVLKTFYSQPNITDSIIEDAENDDEKKRELVKELITKIVPYKINTFQKLRREKGKEMKKAYTQTDTITIKNGAVLLEVYTINGIFYVFYNANGREAVRYAYYMSGAFVNFQDGINKFAAYDAGEYFVVSNPSLVMDSKEPEEFLSVNEFVDIAKANEWVITYQYKPE